MKYAAGVGQRISRYQSAKGWDGKELANFAGVDPARISEWTNARRRPQYKQLQRIASTARDPGRVLRWLAEDGPEPPEVVYGGLRAGMGAATDPLVALAVGELVQAVARDAATGAFINEWAERLYNAGRASAQYDARP